MVGYDVPYNCCYTFTLRSQRPYLPICSQAALSCLVRESRRYRFMQHQIEMYTRTVSITNAGIAQMHITAMQGFIDDLSRLLLEDMQRRQDKA